MRLQSLRDGYRAVVFGASGGIGAAFVDVLLEDARCALVYAGARGDVRPRQGVRPFHFNLEQESTIIAAAERMQTEGAIHLVIIATGLLHDALQQPEKSARAVEASGLARSYAINAIGPAIIAKHFLPLLARNEKSVLAALSARVGSIGDNRSGGWHAYRASKAALNQLIRCFSIELAARSKEAVCVVLHPGTVDTRMSAPFQAGVRRDKLLAPRVSAQHLLGVIDSLTPEKTGGFFAWDGQAIEY